MFNQSRRLNRYIFRRALSSYIAIVIILALSVEHFLHIYSYRIPKAPVLLDQPFATECVEPDIAGPRANAAIVMLARNSEVNGAVQSIASLEKQFNGWFHYPVIFLNDQPFDQHFVDSLTRVVSGQVQFETISNSSNMWGFPDWVDTEKARTRMAEQEKMGIKYAGLENYHHMCRFYSGKFFDHEALKPYKWYWRVEPDNSDPFLAMQKANKVYGWVMGLWELGNTVPSLFSHVATYKLLRGIPSSPLWKSFVDPSWAPLPIRPFLRYLPGRDSHGDAWNFCHYWSNFEIADMDWFRSHEYRDFFQALDETGGFHYERVRHDRALSLGKYTDEGSGGTRLSIH
ncbi:hypothetical protein MMC26_001944 [Xylographa opegraphella]|nr:hypothetical protein [Xylographa opegraphella]